MKKPLMLSVILVVTLVGCSSSKVSTDTIKASKEKSEPLVTETSENKTGKNTEKIEQTIDQHHEEFSYLNDLSEEEMGAYQLFKEDHDINHLKGFSPEQVVLVYFHSVANHDVKSIYALTYDNETSSIPFEIEYYNKYKLRDEDLAMKFRNYDSLTSEEDGVEIKVAFGSIRYLLVVGVKKENDIWKIDMPK